MPDLLRFDRALLVERRTQSQFLGGAHERFLPRTGEHRTASLYNPLSRPLSVAPAGLAVSSLTPASGALAPPATGASFTGVTVTVAVTIPPPRPLTSPLTAACSQNLNVFTGLFRFNPGVNFNPPFPSAYVIKSPLRTSLVPFARYTFPFVIPVTRKCVTSAPSAAFRLTTSPLVVVTSSNVVAFVTPGVSATGLTVMVEVT